MTKCWHDQPIQATAAWGLWDVCIITNDGVLNTVRGVSSNHWPSHFGARVVMASRHRYRGCLQAGCGRQGFVPSQNQLIHRILFIFHFIPCPPALPCRRRRNGLVHRAESAGIRNVCHRNEALAAYTPTNTEYTAPNCDRLSPLPPPTPHCLSSWNHDRYTEVSKRAGAA